MRPQNKERYTAEKFGNLSKLLNQATGKIEAEKSCYKADLDIKNLPPDGEWVSRGVFRIERRFAWGKAYGKKILKDPSLSSEELVRYGAYKSPVYLDLETTGLSGGTGTYAFLVGLGFCEKEYFKVVQLFLAGPGWERNWLAQLEAEIPDENYGLVTYNGATFDLPLLRIRYTIARALPKWNAVPHLDLLKLARHFYRGKFDSCSLSSIEEKVLGLNRTDDDIPGSEIPWLYTNFLRTQDARPLAGIFYHNTLDIVSLAAFQNHLASLLCGEGSGWEQLRAGDLRYKYEDEHSAVRHWAKALEFENSEKAANERLAQLAKNSGDFATAQQYLRNALKEDLAPYENLIKLAKIEEHKTKELDLALGHAKKALEFLQKHHFYDWRAEKQQSDTRLRIARIEKKIAKMKEQFKKK